MAQIRRKSTANALLAAEARNGALLQHAKQLDLHRQRHVADLVEEQRAAVRLLEQAVLEPHRTGERAPLVPEQLGFEQVLGNAAAVHRDERLARAQLVQAVNLTRHDFLADARLAR